MKLYKYEKKAIDKLIGKQEELGVLWLYDRKINICRNPRRAEQIEKIAEDYFEVETLFFNTDKLLKEIK